MTVSRDNSIAAYRKKYFGLLAFLFFAPVVFSQPSKADSLRQLLATEQTDTSKVRLMWQLGSAVNSYDPVEALSLSQQALYLAKRIKYTEGISRSLGVLSNTFIKISNYPRALELNFEKLQIEEKRNQPRSYASVLMNIGVIYALQEEYVKSLQYYAKSDSVIKLHHVDEFRYYIALNVGDAYNRLNISDSSYKYFNQSLEIAKELEEGDFIGTSMTGLGHSYSKLGNPEQSLLNYRTGIRYLREANDDEILCEATLGLAKLYEKINQFDSAAQYGFLSFSIAKMDGFLSHQLEASKFLSDHYKKAQNIDSAFVYVSYVQQLNDSVNNKSRIRESQIISSNEQFRQLELEESRRLAKEERRQQLQMLLIGVFIPGFFLLTLSLRKAKLNIKFIRLLGILSLLFFFEYLTLLLHPTVARLTNHTPFIEILIFVVIAAFLIPAHHRIEHWFIQKLVQHRKPAAGKEKEPATESDLQDEKTEEHITEEINQAIKENIQLVPVQQPQGDQLNKDGNEEENIVNEEKKNEKTN